MGHYMVNRFNMLPACTDYLQPINMYSNSSQNL
jgi:hypothetical protein